MAKAHGNQSLRCQLLIGPFATGDQRQSQFRDLSFTSDRNDESLICLRALRGVACFGTRRHLFRLQHLTALDFATVPPQQMFVVLFSFMSRE